MKKTFFKFLMLFGMLAFAHGIQAQNTVRGTVNDPAENEGLIGANILIKGTSIGTTTDIDGNFTLTSGEPLPWTLEVSYTGYSTQEVVVATNNSTINVDLTEGVIFGDDIVISASRKREKVQEAPASISVISARKLETSANATDAVRNLTNVAGVQIQQQSANSINISMRGGAGLFGTGVFPIMDYRSLVGPGIGTFQSSQAGISNIDLQRIEVVRGPGSALYGPGVTQGVVHFITKSPIDEPGTTVELMGGELSTFGGTVRHATKISDKFGFKINAQYKQGKEFTLDPNDPGDALQIAKFLPGGGVFTPGVSEQGFVDATLAPTQIYSFADLDEDGDGNPMSDSWDNSAINATLEFRPKDNLNVTLAGGFNGSHAVFYNEQGEGFAAGREYWGQARMQAGGLFAQVFVVDNDGGGPDDPTFLYQTGNNTSLARTQVEGQLQYNFGIEKFLNSDWTAGVDYRLAQQRTENLVYGRNEDDDDYNVVGGYVQGKFALSPKLDLVAAGRYDKFNFIDDGAFAPRLALVYKANPKHTFRASYNKTNSTVSNLQLNIDFPLSTIIPGQFDVWLYGNKTTQTFGDNPNISWAIPGLIPDVPAGTDGLPLGVPFALVNTPTIAGITAFLEADATTAALAPIIGNILENIDGATLGTTGSLSPGFNIFDGTPLTPIDAPISTLSTSDNFEVGYKGLINNKLGVSLDVYSITERNNSQFTAISPAYRLSGYDALPEDLGNSVFGQAGPQIIAALTPLLGAAGAEATAEALAPLIIGGYTQGGDAALNTANAAFGGISLNQLLTALPFHAVNQTAQTPVNGTTHLAAGYRTFDERSYLGADLGLDYYFSDDVSAFFNYSWVSENQFMQRVIGNEAAGELPSYLNIPKNKFRAGVNYAPVQGLRGSLSFQHDDAYVANAGQFSTDDPTTLDVVEKTDPRNLLDAAVGYKFSNGLAFDVTATNVLNTQYRYLPNMPKIGRRVLGKLVYTFGGKKDMNAGGMNFGATDAKDMDSDGDGIKDSKDLCPNIAGIKKYKGCPMSQADMAAKAAADAKLAAAAKAKMEMEAAARAEEEARLAKIAAEKAAVEAAARAEEEAKMAAERAATDAAAAAAAAAKAASASTEHSHPGTGTHSHANSGNHTHVGSTGTTSSTATRDSEVAAVFNGALTGIQFTTGQNSFTSQSYNIMAQVVDVMNRYPSMNVTIEGHTDSVGSRDTNKALSQKRASAVKTYLVSKGISSSRLTAIGYGEARPIADNMNKEGRNQNRRVAFVPTYR